MGGNFEQARQFFVQGLGHYQAGRFERAELDFAAALALMPGRVSTLTNLGATRLKLGKFQEAADLLAEAIAQEPDNVEALAHRATALAELGHFVEALATVQRAVSLDPRLGPAWTLHGNLLKSLGREQEACTSFENAIERGGDPELNRYYLASLNGNAVPATAPRQYVESLFDGYADDFEVHLVEVLKYDAPSILAAELARTRRRFSAALDLGCGTGLCGVAVRPLTDRLDGVDLSSNMVERAAARSIYDSVVQADLIEYLVTTPQRYDLVLAADVFIYVGALEQVFSGVARVLATGGMFCFSVEAAPEGQQLDLRPSLRYAHSRGYIEKLAEQYGFEIATTAEHPIREDQRTPIPGLFAWLSRR
jgi:predicted TPR repeat methyltransferase